MGLDHVCPICHRESVHDRSVPDWGEMRCCPSCRLVFANPMTLPESPESFYSKAYRGFSEYAGMEDYSRRISGSINKANKGSIDSERIHFCGARADAMTWIKENISPGSVVLDIGCATGYFPRLLRKNGFMAVGLEVAKECVDMLTDEGFQIWHGTIDSIPYNWNQPVLCTTFFVLHHLPDPVGFLATIRSKFPNANLLVGVWNRFPSPQRISAASLPPRTLTWWSPQSLQKAMEKAEYQVDSVSELIHPYEFGMPRVTRGRFTMWARSSGHYRLLSIYYAVKPKVVWPWRFWKRLTGKPSSVLARGKPC